MKKKVVLAFSGGLDTTYCVKFLQANHWEVHTAFVHTGGWSETELKGIEQHALALGAANHHTIEATQAFYDGCLRYLIAGNILRGQVYPLCVSAERAFQAHEVAKLVLKLKADAVAHGSTGAGNDQVRFDVAFRTLCPQADIITPIRDMKLSRENEVQFLREHGVKGDWAKAEYSINRGLWGTSVGGKETLTSDQPLPEQAYPTPVTETEPVVCTLGFEAGHPVTLNGQEYVHPAQLIANLTILAAPFGIGRGVHVGDTVIGIKGRVAFEASAALIIIESHRLLEKHVLTKQQQMLKEQLASPYGALIHEGMYLEPALRDIEAMLASSQKRVTGEVSVLLAPYRFEPLGIRSSFDMMGSRFGAYGEMPADWSGDDVRGFSKILANQLRLFYQVGQDG